MMTERVLESGAAQDGHIVTSLYGYEMNLLKSCYLIHIHDQMFDLSWVEVLVWPCTRFGSEMQYPNS